MSLFDFEQKSYAVDYHGQENMFQGAEKSFKAGTEVELSYGLIATDTDYSFFVDGQKVNAKWDNKRGYVVAFTMPEHDIEVYCTKRNSMIKEDGHSD